MLRAMDELLPSSVFGLPLHALVVHATVVVVPLAAVVVMLAAVLPRFRRWAGLLPVLLAGGALVLTPVTTGSGGDFWRLLQAQGAQNPLVVRHAGLGEFLVWWVVPLFLVALVTYAVERRERRAGAGAGTPLLTLGLAVLGVAVAAGTVVHVVRIGHSGTEAAWGYLSE